MVPNELLLEAVEPLLQLVGGWRQRPLGSTGLKLGLKLGLEFVLAC